MTTDRGFLGTGWRFPVQVTPNGRIARASDEQRIEESIYLILSTAKGERLMFAEFGCGIHELVFTPNNPGAVSMVARAVRQGLVAFEPRIDVLDVAAESSPSRPELLLIRVSYRIRSNNARGNLVYPFYITERS